MNIHTQVTLLLAIGIALLGILMCLVVMGADKAKSRTEHELEDEEEWKAVQKMAAERKKSH